MSKIIGNTVGTPISPKKIAEKTGLGKLSEDIATKASAIKEKASGEVIVVTDSDERKPLGLAIDGKSEQNQYSGNQLFDASLIPTKTINNTTVTNNGDGSFTINGVNNDSISHYANVSLSLFKAGKVYLKTNVHSQPFFYVSFVNPNGNIEINNRNSTLVSADLTEEFLSGVTNVRFGFFGSGTYEVYNGVITPMVYQDGDGTFEPYCGGIPSPNPSYPQEIRNIGVYDEASGKYAVEVEFDNNNLWLVNIKGYVDSNNKIMIIDNNSESFVIKAKKGVTYCFGSDIQTNRMVIGYSTDIPNVNNNKFFESEILTSKNFVSKHDSYVTIYVYANRDDNVKESFRVNVGDTLLPYEQPKRITAKVLLDEPLRKGDKAYWNGGSKVRVDRVMKSIIPKKLIRSWLNETGLTICGIVAEDAKRFANNIIADVMSNSFIAKSGDTQYTTNNNCVSNNSNGQIIVTVANVATADELTDFLEENDVEIQYELETPITEEIDIDLGELTMFYPTTIISNDCNANMEVTYIADTKAYIDKKFAELATAMV